MANITGAPGSPDGKDRVGEQLILELSEQRLVSLGLAAQITDDWRAPALPGQRDAHALYSHLLGWDEWASAIFELEPPLPAKLVAALRDVDAFNARVVGRFAGIPRDDLLTALHWSSARVISAARGAAGANWSQRRIPDLAPPEAGPTSRGPRVSAMLTMLLEHEREHASEVSQAYNVKNVNLSQLRQEALGVRQPDPSLDEDGEDEEDREDEEEDGEL